MKVVLTDRFVASDKRIPASGRKDFPDALVPGFALRVTATGHRSFNLISRFPSHPKHPTRRALGDVGELTLSEARDKARAWHALIRRGIDPAVEEARERAANQRAQGVTFAHVAGEFMDRHCDKLAHAKQARAIITTEFIAKWGPRPVTDITPEECAAAIRAIVRRDAPAQARNALGHLRRLYSWAIGCHEFGIATSPVAALKPNDLIGARVARDRVLTDDELRAVWNATAGRWDAGNLAEARRRDCKADATAPLGYPYGPLFRLLILTGQREGADACWSEIDFDKKLWTIPASRMKGGRAHAVPLAPDALALLKALPRFTDGDFCFSTTGGRKSLNGFSKAKQRLDKASGVDGFVLHDLRRTVRTHFSALPVQDNVREMVIAHARPGLHRVYDHHAYLDEKRDCLRLWELRLRGILNPAPADVTDIDAERARMAVA